MTGAPTPIKGIHLRGERCALRGAMRNWLLFSGALSACLVLWILAAGYQKVVQRYMPESQITAIAIILYAPEMLLTNYAA